MAPCPEQLEGDGLKGESVQRECPPLAAVEASGFREIVRGREGIGGECLPLSLVVASIEDDGFKETSREGDRV